MEESVKLALRSRAKPRRVSLVDIRNALCVENANRRELVWRVYSAILQRNHTLTSVSACQLAKISVRLIDAILLEKNSCDV